MPNHRYSDDNGDRNSQQPPQGGGNMDNNKPWKRRSRQQLAFICTTLLLYTAFTFPGDIHQIRHLLFSQQQHSWSNNAVVAHGAGSMRMRDTTSFILRGENHTLQIAWIMSFPNSGTSFTIKHIRSLAQTQSATNYGHENARDSWGEPDAKTESVPVFGDQPGGPFWVDLSKNPNFKYPQNYVLVKTHCGGRCETCPPERFIETTYSFRAKCLSGKRRFVHAHNDSSFYDVKVEYPMKRVAKAIHLIRDPLANVVSRFHMERHGNRSANASDYGTTKDDFRRYCAYLNRRFEKEEERSILFRNNRDLWELVKEVPCRADFVRYVEWHNQAFALTNDAGLDTLIVHYDEYTNDFNGVSARLLSFLGLQARGEPYEFVPGKTYQHFFSVEERRAVAQASEQMASRNTWSHIKKYFAHEEDEEPEEEEHGTPDNLLLTKTGSNLTAPIPN